MMMKVVFLLSTLLIVIFVVFTRHTADAHGYLADPPARSSAWLFDKRFAECCTYYNHMEMFCGGTLNQWLVHGGKCGICGEEWNAEKKFEKGGELYRGTIVKTYKQGESINATVHVTANHYGWFEFRICNVDGWETDATQECLNKTVITFADTSDTRLSVKNYSSPAIINFKLNLPPDLTCKHCVLQWKYRCGNRWGIDEATNASCMGCGPIQEHFFGCADIAIKPKNAPIEDSNNGSGDAVTTTTTVKATTQKEINKPTSDNADSSYNGCRSKLYYGKKVDLSKAVTLYCSMVCKTMCGDDSSDKENAIDPLEKSSICKQTCPTLCSCEK